MRQQLAGVPREEREHAVLVRRQLHRLARRRTPRASRGRPGDRRSRRRAPRAARRDGAPPAGARAARRSRTASSRSRPRRRRARPPSPSRHRPRRGRSPARRSSAAARGRPPCRSRREAARSRITASGGRMAASASAVLGRLRRDDVVARAAEVRAERPQDLRLVVDDEDPCCAASSRGLDSRRRVGSVRTSAAPACDGLGAQGCRRSPPRSRVRSRARGPCEPPVAAAPERLEDGLESAAAIPGPSSATRITTASPSGGGA